MLVDLAAPSPKPGATPDASAFGSLGRVNRYRDPKFGKMVPLRRLSPRSLNPKVLPNVSCRLDRNRRLLFDIGGDRLLEFETARIIGRLFFGRPLGDDHAGVGVRALLLHLRRIDDA